MSEDEYNDKDAHSFKHPVIAYAFAILEYVKNTNPELYKRAVEYAEDLTGVELEGFELEEIDSEDQTDDENPEQNEDDEFYG